MSFNFIRLTTLIVLFSGLIIILFACEYQPTGTNFRDIDSNYTGTITTFELPKDGDTIFIESDKTYEMTYKLSGDLNKFNQVIFFRDNNQFNKSTKPEGTISLKIKTEKQYTYYTLTMLVVSHSGTGSLADINNMEGTLQEKSWVLCVYNRSNFEAEPIKYSEVDGSLILNWNKYDFPEFICYIVSKTVGDYSSQIMDTIYNRNYPQFNDSTYVGEEVIYNIVCKYRKDGYITTFGYPTLKKSKEIPSVTVKKLSDKSFELSWGKSKYINNIKGYLFHNNKITNRIVIDSPDIFSTTISNIAVSINDSLKFFPLPKYYNFKNSDTSTEERYINNIPIFSGEIGFKFDQIHATPDNHIIFSQNVQGYKLTLNKYSIPEGKVVNQLNFSTPTSNGDRVAFSPKGKHVVFKNTTFVSYCLDGNFDNMRSLSDKEISGAASDYGFEEIAVSDNGILAAFVNNMIYIVDLKTRIKLMSLADYPQELVISSDGDYLALMTQVNGDFFTKVYSLKSGSPVFITDKFNGFNITFDPDNNSRLYYHDIDNEKLCYIDCDTKIITPINNSNSYLNWQIDFVERHLIVSKVSGEYEIRNLDNFSLIYEYKSNYGCGFINKRKLYLASGVLCSY